MRTESQVNQPSLQTRNDCLCSIAVIKAHRYHAYVALYGGLGNSQLNRDFLV
jgi:hypothetical protein